MFGTRKLGKTSTQRKALLRQQVTDLLENGKMETTFYRAKEGFLMSPCYSLELCIQMDVSFLFSFAFCFSSFHSYL